MSYIGSQMSYGVNGFVGSIRAVGQLQKKYNELLLENISLKTQLALVKKYYDENEALRRQLNLGNTEADLLLAEIIGVDQYTGQDHIILNKGERDGVKEGQTVVLGNVYIGLVTDTEEQYCKVRVPRSGESYLKVKVVPIELDSVMVEEMQQDMIGGISKYADGVAIGSSTGIKVENVAVTYPLAEGQSVIVADEKVSDWLFLGSVTEVSEGPASTSKSCYIKRPINSSELKFVYIQL
ncbi:hypothetical protein GF357_02940 [Candidatus Dojkabacteria bacterium]|nr:hypothetical protein [Candidatus Dojkabacteria bacterium]